MSRLYTLLLWVCALGTGPLLWAQSNATACSQIDLHLGEPEAHPTSCALLRIPVWLAADPGLGTPPTQLRARNLEIEGTLTRAVIIGIDATDGSGFVDQDFNSLEATFTVQAPTPTALTTFPLRDASNPHFWLIIDYETGVAFDVSAFEASFNLEDSSPTGALCTLDGQLPGGSVYPYTYSPGSCPTNDAFAIVVDVAQATNLSDHPNGKQVIVKLQYQPGGNPNYSGSLDLAHLSFDLRLDDVDGNLEFTQAEELDGELGSDGELIYFEASGMSGADQLTFTNGFVDLFTINITGPTSPLTGGRMDFSVTRALVQKTASMCCEPSWGPATLLLDYTRPCPGVSMVVEIGEAENGNDCAFSVPVILRNETNTTQNYERLLVELNPPLPPGIVLDETATLGTVDCPFPCDGGATPCLRFESGRVIYDKCGAFSIDAYSEVVLFKLRLNGEGDIPTMKADEVIYTTSSSACTPGYDLDDHFPMEATAGQRVNSTVRMLCNTSYTVEGVEVCAHATSCTDTDCFFSASTNSQGVVSLPDCPRYDDAQVRAFKTDNPTCGVTTLDVIAIQRHILATDPFTEPWELLASDLNGTGSISTLDLVALRRIILGIDVLFPSSGIQGTNPWIFVPSTHTFSGNPLNDTFDPCLGYDDLKNLEYFQAIKKGDVHCSNQCANNAATRDLVLELQDAGVNVTNERVLRLAVVSGFTDIAALQFGLAYPAGEWSYSNHSTAALSYVDSNAYHELGKGWWNELRTAWYHQGGGDTTLTAGEILWEWRFTPSSGATFDLTEFVLDTLGMAALAYQSTDVPLRVVLTYEGESLGGSGENLRLGAAPGPRPEDELSVSVRPNPASASGGGIYLDVQSGQTATADWWVEDLQGRRVAQGRLGLSKGLTQGWIPSADHWPAGVYHVFVHSHNRRVHTRLVKQ